MVVPVGVQEGILVLKILSIFAISSPKFLFPYGVRNLYVLYRP